MNNKYIFLLVGFLAGAGILAATVLPGRVQTGGDFPGGIQPTNLLTDSVSGNYVQPVGSFLFASPNGAYVGGTSQNNQLALIASASSTVGTTTLAAFTASTSSVTTTVPIAVAGLSTNDLCIASINAAPSNSFGIDCSITTSTSAAATATVTLWNGASSSVTIATGTPIRVLDLHLPY